MKPGGRGRDGHLRGAKAAPNRICWFLWFRSISYFRSVFSSLNGDPGCCAILNRHNDLDCPTAANAAFEAKGLFGELSNHTDPPDKSRNPADQKDHGASKEDRLGGTIENINTALSQNTQARTCEHCGDNFQPRKRNGGKAQRFCSAECRSAFHNAERANVSDTPNVSPPVANVSVNVSSAGAQSQKDDDEFNWGSDSSVALRGQRATAVYFNRFDELVIRQEAGPNDCEDSFVYISSVNIQEFLDRLTDACGVPSVP
jgi:hypothetical protein